MKQSISWPLQRSECLLFLNGHHQSVSPELIRSLNAYKHIIACDGAWNYLSTRENQILANHISAVMGDGDSITNPPDGFIELADQNTTDFEKVLQQLINQRVKSVDVYWASGGEMDHFLGNLSVAAKYHQKIAIRFYDANHCYFYADQDYCFTQAKSRVLTIYPFPQAIVSSEGLRYEIHDYEMHVTSQQSLRNVIIDDEANLAIDGGVFLFVAN